MTQIPTLASSESRETRTPLVPFVVDGHKLLIGDLTLDLAGRTIHGHGDRSVRLSSNEFKVLATLCKTPGRFVDHDVLLRAVAGDELCPPPGIVATYVKYLRRQLQVAGSAATIDVSANHEVRLTP